MNSIDLLRTLRKHVITEAFHGEPPDDFGDDYDLIESGVMDSLLMMDLITHFTRLYSVELGINDLVPANFHSISALARLIEGKLTTTQREDTTTTEDLVAAHKP